MKKEIGFHTQIFFVLGMNPKPKFFGVWLIEQNKIFYFRTFRLKLWVILYFYYVRKTKTPFLNSITSRFWFDTIFYPEWDSDA